MDESCVLVDGPWTHRFVGANGSRFHVVEAGTGPLVLFLHGFPEFWWAWHDMLPAVADAGFRAVAVDLRGYGASDKPPRGYDGYTMAADVTGLIRALGERSAMIVGAGFGGMIGWTAAAFHPKMVRPAGRARRGAPAAAAGGALRRPARPARRVRADRCASSCRATSTCSPRTTPRWSASCCARWGGPAWVADAGVRRLRARAAARRCRSRRRRSARWRRTGGRSGRRCGCTGTGSSS